MPLDELAQADGRAILSLDGDRVTLTAPAALGSGVYSVPCNYVRRGMTRDAEGLAVVGDASALTVSLGELASKGLADPETLKTKGWLATTASDGSAWRLDLCLIDYTLGEATIMLKRSAA